MSLDEASSRVIYTSISSDYEEPSDVGLPGVVIYGYDGLLIHPVDLPLLDYVPGPEEPEQASLSPDYVPGLEHPYYIADSDPEEDPEDESEDGPAEYPVDEGDDDDSFRDDTNDEDEEEEEASNEEEEEEHLAPADFTAASPVVDPVPSVEEIVPFETDESAATPPPPAYRTTARMSIRAQAPIPFLSEAEVDRLLAIPTPPPSPLTPLSSPLPSIPSPPFYVPSLPTTSPTYAEAPLGFKAAEIRLRAASPLPSPTTSPTTITTTIIALATTS
ncbi:hypothetical protein Tco_1298415 [Tanacetum coccineum]